jgi:malonyl-CoA O-methyltransferase
VTLLDAREGYRLWAPTYAGETAVSHLEDKLVKAMTPPLHGLRLLDAGCGTGRRLLDCGAASAVGIDLCREMLEAGIGIGSPNSSLMTMVGDICDLPLPDQAFDVIWCRLVLGHLPECAGAYAELGRVADHGAIVVVSDFHPAAHAAGHRRTFRHGESVHEVTHHVHSIREQLDAARAAGLELVQICEAEIGPEVLGFYERAGRSELYRAHEALPVVLAIAFRAGAVICAS